MKKFQTPVSKWSRDINTVCVIPHKQASKPAVVTIQNEGYIVRQFPSSEWACSTVEHLQCVTKIQPVC